MLLVQCTLCLGNCWESHHLCTMYIDNDLPSNHPGRMLNGTTETNQEDDQAIVARNGYEESDYFLQKWDNGLPKSFQDI